MQKWRVLISRGFLYFLISIITPFIGCLYLLNQINHFQYAEAYSIGADAYNDPDLVLSAVFFGDAMFDRNVRILMEKHGFEYPLSGITSFIKEHDLAMLNLEGVYTENPSVSKDDFSKLQFTFDPAGAFYLARAGFNFVSQANNHANDFGREGAQSSRVTLESAGVSVVGDYFNESGATLFKKKGHKIALVGFNEFSGNNLDEVVQSIRDAKRGGYSVIVLPHFGVEYERFASSNQKKLAHAFIDAGAEIVLGTHPHVIQALEEYQGKLIVYSLGNLVFDQYWNKEVQTGLAAKIVFDKSALRLQLIPIISQNSKPILAASKEAKDILSDLANDSDISKINKEKIKSGDFITLSN